MNDIHSEAAIHQQATNWETVLAEVNAWRGACVHHFSAVEVAVTETLIALSGVKPQGAAISLRHLTGQRLEDLAAALVPSSPFHEAGKHALRDLTQYREEHEAFRNLLCHGIVKVAVERSGHWIIVVRLLAIRSGQAERSTQALTQSEALAKLDVLRRDGQKVVSTLGQLRKTVAG